MALQFAPFISDIELPFYSALASLKINHDKLDDSARKVLGLYEVRPSDPSETSCRMQILGNALTSDELVDPFCPCSTWIQPVIVPDMEQRSESALPSRRHHQELQHGRGIPDARQDRISAASWAYGRCAWLDGAIAAQLTDALDMGGNP